ncbi:hypothetical protein ACI3PL_27365, partial [Lacticaseibacillus paracasei]
SVAYTGTAGTIATAISDGVFKVRVVLTTAGYVKVDKSPTATTSDVYMAADAPEYFTCRPGMKVSAIQLSSAGTLHVTECA